MFLSFSRTFYDCQVDFFKIQGQFKDKLHFFRIPGVFQDQGHFQGLFKVCVNPGVPLKLLIPQSKFSGPRKFTLRYHLIEITGAQM